MKAMSCLSFALCAAVMFGAETGNRKVTQNKLSPPAETTIQLGGQPVTIEYNAPSARDPKNPSTARKVEGGLIPYGSVWRLGADSATTLTTGTDLMIGTLRVPKGVHTLYVLASETGWKLIVNKQTGQWGTVYQEAQDLGRTDMQVSKLPSAAETMKITLRAANANSGTLEVEWGSTKAVVPVKVP